MKSFRDQILYFDNHVVVAYKPAGMLSQKDQTGDDSILEYIKAFIAEEFNKPGKVFLGSVHRLDRPAEGLMVFAKTSKALGRLNKAFREGEVNKTYLAVVEGIPALPVARIEDYLWKDKKKNRVKRFDQPGDQRKKAILSYELIANHQELSLLKIALETGRPHQIRVQLAGIGCPVVGDLKYGAKLQTGDQSICLMSKSLEFIHPVKKERIHFEKDIPRNKKYWRNFKL